MTTSGDSEKHLGDDAAHVESLSPPILRKGRFVNPWPGAEPAGFLDFLRWQIGRRVRQEIVRGAPWPPLEVTTPTFARPRAAPGRLLATWIGHSTTLIQIGGINVLTDPIWSERASPFRRVGPRRMVPPGALLDELPPIDVVLLSHNHYDHLDDRTVRRLIARMPDIRWVVPLRLGDFLASRGARQVEELGWGDERRIANLTLGCAPAQHHSARGLGDRGRSLWCGWSIASATARAFFAGDTGYHPEFRAIGSRFGPFDLTVIPIGAYEPRWFMRSVHMNPEEAVRAHLELTVGQERRAAMLAIHWGTYRLTDEPAGEPPDRARSAWADASLLAEDLWVLRAGETRERELTARSP